jgi:hypothetical protein
MLLLRCNGCNAVAAMQWLQCSCCDAMAAMLLHRSVAVFLRPSVSEGDGERGADVYAVPTDSKDDEGVWHVENILEAPEYEDGKGLFKPYTIAMEVMDVPGVLNQVSEKAVLWGTAEW